MRFLKNKGCRSVGSIYWEICNLSKNFDDIEGILEGRKQIEVAKETCESELRHYSASKTLMYLQVYTPGIQTMLSRFVLADR